MSIATRRSFPLVATCVVGALALNLLGAIDARRIPHLGYNRVGDEVQAVIPDGPASLAGFRNGDVLVSIAGAPINAPATGTRIAPAAIGTPRDYLLRRGEEEILATLTPTSLPREQSFGLMANRLIGLAFLLCGVIAYFRSESPAATTFALLGAAAAPAMGNPPFRVLPPSTASVLGWLWPVLALAAVVLFLCFVLLIPSRHPWLENRWGKLAIFGVPSLAAVALLFRVPVPFFVLEIAYLLLGAGLLWWRYRSASPAERSNGLDVLFWLTIAALVPYVTIAVLSQTGVITNPFITQVGGFSLVLAPVAMLLAVLKARDYGAPREAAA